MDKWLMINKNILFITIFFMGLLNNSSIFSYDYNFYKYNTYEESNLLNNSSYFLAQNQENFSVSNTLSNDYQSLLTRESMNQYNPYDTSQDPYIEDIIYPNGFSFMHIAVMTEDIQMINAALIQKKESINAKDDDGYTPLHYAIITGNQAIIELLVMIGADLNSANYEGETPIFLAIQNNLSLDLIKYLIQKGADPFLLNNEEETLLDIAYQYDRKVIIKYLENEIEYTKYSITL